MIKPIIFMAVMLVLALMGPFFMQGGSLQDLAANPFALFMSSGPGEDKQEFSNVRSDETFYKWQDENGQWHFGDREFAPQDSKQVSVNTNANIIQSFKTEEEKEEEKKESKPRVTLIPDSFKPEKIKETFEKAADAKDMQEMRVEDLQEMLKQQGLDYRE